MTETNVNGLDIRQPFERSAALRAGITQKDLIGRRYRRLIHGVYISAELRPTGLDRARAALHVAGPGAYLSHHSAAKVWGGTVPDDARVHVSVQPDAYRNQRKGIAVHVQPRQSDLRKRNGLWMASPSQCFCEIASSGASLVDLVVLGDSLVRAGAVTPEDLVAAADAWNGRKAAIGSRAARLVREGVDSAMESRLRMLIVAAGLPEPVVNFIIRYDNGDWQMRFDLSYPDEMILIEYDGEHHLTPKQWASDLERREQLQQLGWRTVTIQKNQFYGRPWDVLRRIREALLDRGVSAARCRIRRTWTSEFAV